MFKALLARTIFDGLSEERSTKVATLTKEITLPFPPALDIELSICAIGPTKLAKIKWQHEASYFLCEFEGEFSRALGGYQTDLDRLLAYADADGWKVVSIDPLD